jgi:hypothetical protein
MPYDPEQTYHNKRSGGSSLTCMKQTLSVFPETEIERTRLYTALPYIPVWHGVSKGVVRQPQAAHSAADFTRNSCKAVSGVVVWRVKSGRAWRAIAML